MNVKELFAASLMGADTSLDFGAGAEASIGGFLAKTSGTITISVHGTTIVDAVPVTEGIYTPIPLGITKSVAVTLAGGASGTLFH